MFAAFIKRDEAKGRRRKDNSEENAMKMLYLCSWFCMLFFSFSATADLLQGPDGTITFEFVVRDAHSGKEACVKVMERGGTKFDEDTEPDQVRGKRGQCGLAMSRSLVGANPTWVVVSREPSIEPCGAHGNGRVDA